MHYPKRNFPTVSGTVDQKIVEEMREGRREESEALIDAEVKQKQDYLDEADRTRQEVSAAKQRMSDQLKPVGDHSMHYKKRPEFYKNEKKAEASVVVAEKRAEELPTELTDTQVASIASVIKRDFGEELDTADSEELHDAIEVEVSGYLDDEDADAGIEKVLAVLRED